MDHFCYLFCVCHAFLSVLCSLVVPAGKGQTFLALFVFLSLSNVVSWIRCGTCLYQFLIFAFLLTFVMIKFY